MKKEKTVKLKKILEYKAKIRDMSVKIEDLKNTEENNTHLRKRSEKQQLDLTSKTKEITNLKQKIINLEKTLKEIGTTSIEFQCQLEAGKESSEKDEELEKLIN